MFHLQIWQKRQIIDSTKPTIRRLNFCDIYFLKISVHVCISVAQQENTVAILPKIWKRPCSSLGEQGLSSIEKQKNFRAFCARKALRTLRLTQCPQNWLTMMAGSANFEDRCCRLYSRIFAQNIASKTLTSSKLRRLWAKNRIGFFFLLQLLPLFRFVFEFWGW